MVGLFCRAFFPIQTAIDEFLSDVYEPSSAVPGRYQYIQADSVAGILIIEDKFAYSFHASDPACGMTLNAFDLVRIHKFGNDDEKKSFRDMCAFAMSLEEVRLKSVTEKAEICEKDSAGDDWRSKLTYVPRTNIIENSSGNLALILNNDPDFANIAFNDLAGKVGVTGPVPWTRPPGNRFWRDADTAQLKALIDMKYICFSNRNYEVAFTKVTHDRHFHPIRDYIENLPPWDGKKRIETVLVDCLDAEDTEYTRAVTRKTFAAAVARILCPGTKFDSVLVLDGAQGIGKSTFFKDLVGEEYYSETLSLTDMNDKAGAEKLQGYWIVEIAELAGMKKADIEKVKAFISTSDDVYRPSYSRDAESHPRQCVIIASVNGENGYLRDITGNRRFWIVKLNRTGPKKDWDLKQERDQIWAEAKELWMNGEKLYLEGYLIKAAEEIQRGAMEEDERKGLVENYLNTPLPDNWAKMDLWRRREYLSDPDGATQPKGENLRTTVSNMEIWCECFGNPMSELKHNDSITLAALMMQIPGWQKTDKFQRSVYGKQRIYERVRDSIC